MPTLKEKYQSDVKPKLKERPGVTNPYMVPRLQKVVVNMGIGTTRRDSAEALAEELKAITGQAPVMTRARKSISNFKIREGMIVGAKVTLRGDRMFEFLDRLINAALPRIRDFRGLPRAGFDGRGNYTLGIQEQTIFPEIDPNNVTTVQGLDITIVTTATTDEDALELLHLLGMPFSKN